MTTVPEKTPLYPRWLLPSIDALLILVAFVLAYGLRYHLQLIRPVIDPARADLAPYLPYALLYMTILYVNYQTNGLYRPVRGRALSEEISTIINGVTIGTVILLAVFFLFQPLITSRLMLVYVASLTVVLLSFARVGVRVYLARLRAQGVGVQRVLIVGMGRTGQAVVGTMISRADFGFDVVGFVDDDPQTSEMKFRTVTRLGAVADVPHILADEKIERVVITLAWKHYDHVREIADMCHVRGVEVSIVPDIFQLNMRQLHVENLDGIPLLGVITAQPFYGANRLMKRALDLLIVGISAPLWVSIIGVIALLIKLQDKGTVFYIQRRVGEKGREFNMIKFRSMVPNADAMRQALIEEYGLDPKHPKIENDPRITQLGKFLRTTSLDELPNVLNVVRGEMSLVGPRPPMPDEVALYQAWHKQRLQSIPGITGLWQVSGRSQIPFDEMCLMDIYYIENWSLRFDLQILLMTIPRVLMRVGAF